MRNTSTAVDVTQGPTRQCSQIRFRVLGESLTTLKKLEYPYKAEYVSIKEQPGDTIPFL